MAPPASRDRFFQKTHDNGISTQPHKQHKPRVHNRPRRDDPFFASGDNSEQQGDGEEDERKHNDEDGEEDETTKPQHAPHNSRNNSKRTRPHRSDNTHDDDNNDNNNENHSTTTQQPRKRRKDAPLEMSSKHPTPLPSLSAQTLLQPKSFQPRDPRFDSLLPATSFSTHFNSRGAYSFIDDMKEEEIQQMKKLQKKLKSTEKKEELKVALQQTIGQKREQERKDREQSAMRTWKKQEMTARREGKKPFYLKERDKKAVKLVSEFARLKERGKQGEIVRKVEKKRRQRAQSDLRSMPRQSSGGGQ